MTGKLYLIVVVKYNITKHMSTEMYIVVYK